MLLAPFRPRTYAAAVYLALAFPLGIAYFVGTVVGISHGLGLSILVVGVPILAATLGGVVAVSIGERALAEGLLASPPSVPRYEPLKPRPRSVSTVRASRPSCERSPGERREAAKTSYADRLPTARVGHSSGG